MEKGRSLADEIERLATLSRAAEEPLRNSPDCLYQDSDSVFMQDTEEARQLLVVYKREVQGLAGSTSSTKGDMK